MIVLTIVAIWAIVIPLVILGVSWQITRPRPTAVSQVAQPPALPRCAVPAWRPRRTTTRRVCPAQPRGVRRRPASA